MAQHIFDISLPNDGLGEPLRQAFDEQNQMNTELYQNKVDKVTGKGLSENDYTDADKAKLDGIETGAEVNVQSDWLQNDDTADDYIKNKPSSGNIITYGAYALVGQDLTLFAGWAWQINGGIYSNSSDITINFPYASSGMQRLDLGVLNTLNGIERVEGAEVSSNPFAPNLPENTLFLCSVLLTDSTLTLNLSTAPFVKVPKIQFTADGITDTFDILVNAEITAVFWNGALLDNADWTQSGTLLILTFVPDVGAIIKPI